MFFFLSNRSFSLIYSTVQLIFNKKIIIYHWIRFFKKKKRTKIIRAEWSKETLEEPDVITVGNGEWRRVLCKKIFHSRKNCYLTHVDKKLTSRNSSWRYVSNIFLPLFIVGEFELDTHSVRKTRRRVPLDRKDRVSWLRRVSNYTRADKCQSFNVRIGNVRIDGIPR